MKNEMVKKILAGVICAASTAWYQPCVWAEQVDGEDTNASGGEKQ